MKSSPGRVLASELPLACFLERVRTSFSHDLRTPLGTIVNYAAVLEATPGVGVDEVRDLARRIRSGAQRSARMVQSLANATGLAVRPLRATSTDLFVLARSVLADAGGRGHVRLTPDTVGGLAEVDAEVIGFAWRAYIAVENDTLRKPVEDAVLRIVAERESLVMELRCGGEWSAGTPTLPAMVELDLDDFLRHDGGPERLECALGLRLARELVICLGGELGVRGQPGAGSVLRLGFPLSFPAATSGQA